MPARRTSPRPPAPLGALATRAQGRLRRIVAGWPGVEETRSFGHPAWRAGSRTFAVLDRYRGADCLWLVVSPAERALLLATPGWFPAPYDRAGRSLCVRLDAVDWRRIRPLVRASYSLTAGARPR